MNIEKLVMQIYPLCLSETITAQVRICRKLEQQIESQRLEAERVQVNNAEMVERASADRAHAERVSIENETLTQLLQA